MNNILLLPDAYIEREIESTKCFNVFNAEMVCFVADVRQSESETRSSITSGDALAGGGLVAAEC